MCMVLKGPSTECPALPSQRVGTGLKLVQWSLSLGFARTEECWDSFSPHDSLFGPDAKSSELLWCLWGTGLSLQCFLWATAFPLDMLTSVQGNRICFFACNQRMLLLNMYVLSLWLKKNYETKASRDWWIALWNGGKHGFELEDKPRILLQPFTNYVVLGKFLILLCVSVSSL